MNDRYLEYRKIADTLVSGGHIASPSNDPQTLSPEHNATPAELDVRRAFIRALLEEFEPPDRS